MQTNTPALSVDKFCELHSISRSLFYKALKEGWGPRIMRVGRRTLVSSEAAQEWRSKMEDAFTPETH